MGAEEPLLWASSRNGADRIDKQAVWLDELSSVCHDLALEIGQLLNFRWFSTPADIRAVTHGAEARTGGIHKRAICWKDT